MPGRAGENDLVTKEGLKRDAAMTPRRADDSELELTLGDLRDNALRVRDRESDVHVRMLVAELTEEERDNRSAGARRRAELERPGELAATAAGDVVDKLLLERQQPLRRRVQPQSRLRRLDSPSRAVEQ